MIKIEIAAKAKAVIAAAAAAAATFDTAKPFDGCCRRRPSAGRRGEGE